MLVIIITTLIIISVNNQQNHIFPAPEPLIPVCTIKDGVLQTGDGRLCATTTRYWDCNRPTCSWNPNSCGTTGTCANCSGCVNQAGTTGCPTGTQASLNNLLYEQNGKVYGTAAGSGSLSITSSGGLACGKCYELEITGQCGNPYNYTGTNNCNGCQPYVNEAAAGEKLTVMITNSCPDWQPGQNCCTGCTNCQGCGGGCPPTSQDKNVRGANYHFDIAIPGGGQGAAAACPQGYTWKVNSVEDCTNPSVLPQDTPEYRNSCLIYYNNLNGMDNPMVAFKEVPCPENIPSYQGLNCK